MKIFFFFSFFLVHFFCPPLFADECTRGNCVDGWGTLVLQQGFEYEGQWKDGKPHGKGVVKTPYWTTISSDNWVQGQVQGEGVETYLNGRKYVGEFKDTKYNGIGTDRNPDGRVYVGEFVDGHPHGRGKMTLPDGSVYEGEFKGGHSNGKGKLTLSDGNIYIGEFKNGHPQGKGKFVYPDGSLYEGAFYKGHPHGHGVEYAPDGTVRFAGQWRNGREVKEKTENAREDDSQKDKTQVK